MEEIKIADGIFSLLFAEINHLKNELKEVRTLHTKYHVEEIPIKLKDAAKMYSITVSTLRKYVNEGSISKYTAGKNIMVMPSEVRAWIISNKIDNSSIGTDNMRNILNRNNSIGGVQRY